MAKVGAREPAIYTHYRRTLAFIRLARAMKNLPPHTLWAVGSMEDGPFARLVFPHPNGGYTGGYVEAYADTPADAVAAALEKRPIVYERGFGPGDGDSHVLEAASCAVGSCQRHGRCMYLNHPRCPIRNASPKDSQSDRRRG